MAVLLAIDCSDRACSLALGDKDSLLEEYTDQPRQHAKKLLPMYRDLLGASAYSATDIDAIAVAAGPGSFTGLRIGFSFAQGLAFSLSVPLVLVSSLEALALSSLASLEQTDMSKIFQIHACLDARMGELYVAGFRLQGSGNGSQQGYPQAGDWQREYGDALIAKDDFDFVADYSSSVLVGSGFAINELSTLSAQQRLPDACIRASAVHQLGTALYEAGHTHSTLEAEPVYLRRENAWKTVDQQRLAKADK